MCVTLIDSYREVIRLAVITNWSIIDDNSGSGQSGFLWAEANAVKMSTTTSLNEQSTSSFSYSTRSMGTSHAVEEENMIAPGLPVVPKTCLHVAEQPNKSGPLCVPVSLSAISQTKRPRESSRKRKANCAI